MVACTLLPSSDIFIITDVGLLLFDVDGDVTCITCALCMQWCVDVCLVFVL